MPRAAPEPARQGVGAAGHDPPDPETVLGHPRATADVSSHRVCVVTIPVKTTNPNNGSQGWSRNAAFAKARRRKTQRLSAELHVRSALGRTAPTFPLVVTVTRVAPSQGLDPHDGLGAALKGCIDGIADALGLTNDRDPRVTWRLDQRRGKPKEYAVEVAIEYQPRAREIGV